MPASLHADPAVIPTPPPPTTLGALRSAGHHVRSVAVGDRVLYAQDDHFEVDVTGRTYVVLRERDLHAVASETSEPARSSSGTGLYL